MNTATKAAYEKIYSFLRGQWSKNHKCQKPDNKKGAVKKLIAPIKIYASLHYEKKNSLFKSTSELGRSELCVRLKVLRQLLKA